MDIILDPDINPLVPFFGAIHRFPDIMCHYNDRYTASLINSIIKRNPSLSTIAVLCGYGQTKSIPTYLQFSEATLYDNLKTADSKTMEYFGKTDRIHNMVEKQVILDQLYVPRDNSLAEPSDASLQVLHYLVSHELMGSVNSPDTDKAYFEYIYR